MNKIPIIVHTNVDEFRHTTWPTFVCCRPEKGDVIEANDGTVGYICRVTHAQAKSHDFQEFHGVGGEPILKIEITRHASNY